MPSLHVLMKRQEIDPTRLHGKVAIVLDVLFATSTIVHAFSCGVAEVWPACGRADALTIASGVGSDLLAGEYMAERLAEFAPATPIALGLHNLAGRRLVYSTTNGTPALVAVAQSAFVYAAAFLNGAAVADHVARAHPDHSVLIICAGSADRFNLEDFHGAGHIVAHLRARADYGLTDSALAALSACRGSDARVALHASRVGRLMQARDLGHEVEYASKADILGVVPTLRGRRLVSATA
jgi:2-phosphosulfolactate phosphatase